MVEKSGVFRNLFHCSRLPARSWAVSVLCWFRSRMIADQSWFTFAEKLLPSLCPPCFPPGHHFGSTACREMFKKISFFIITSFIFSSDDSFQLYIGHRCCRVSWQQSSPTISHHRQRVWPVSCESARWAIPRYSETPAPHSQLFLLLGGPLSREYLYFS